MVPAAQPTRVLRPDLVAPEANRFVGDGDSSPRQQVLDFPMAQVEPMVEPDGILDDLRQESVPFVSGSRLFHPQMVARLGVTWQYQKLESDMGAKP